MGVAAFMAEIFDQYRFPIFVQTFDPDSWKEHKARIPNTLPKKVGDFNTDKHDEMALLFLLIQIKKYIESERSNDSIRAEVFVDGGLIRQGGSSITVEGWNATFYDGQVHFCDSKEVFPIQLADFAAFSLNKQQLIVGRQDTETFSEFNMHLLEIISSISMNYQNIDREIVSVEQTEQNRWKSHLRGAKLEEVMRKFPGKE